MSKTFNIAGPCVPGEHYMLPPQGRSKGLKSLIDAKQYFVIHAARQSGKTTLLLDLWKDLNETGHYHCLYCSLETVEGVTDPSLGIRYILNALQSEIKYDSYFPKNCFPQQLDYSQTNTVLGDALRDLCAQLDRPLVLLFDEVDCLSFDVLISFLRQLRQGYVNRSRVPFVHSLILVGMRNIRDYQGQVREESDSLQSASPFNIVTTAQTLPNFTQIEISQLVSQHTQATGQEFSEEVTTRLFEVTQGQPWLVNAVTREIIEALLDNNTSGIVLPEHVEQAVQNLIQRRDTHIDSLLKRIKEPRVQRILEPMILGNTLIYESFDDDFAFVHDLGLIRIDSQKKVIPANPIYAEVMLRLLSFSAQNEMIQQGFPPEAPAYEIKGRLDMKRLLGDFQSFWRQNSEVWQERFQYKEAAPHLLLQAFLQKVVNGGGALVREMALGRGRLDLCLTYKDGVYPMEIKLRYSETTVKQGKQQLTRYMDQLGCNEGWLLVFDRRKTVNWDTKIFWNTESLGEKTLHIVGG